MVRVMDKSVLYLQDIEAPPRPPQRKPQPDFEFIATPPKPQRLVLGPPKKKEPEAKAKIEEVQMEQYVEISLDQDVLNQLEEAASKVGLEVPEELKKTYTVTPDKADETKNMLKEKFDAFLKALDEAYKANKKVQYQVALDENVLNQLETYAAIYGLEVPEELKKTYTVSSEEEKESVEKMLREEFNEFLQKLNEVAYESTLMRLRGFAESYQERHPGAGVIINDAGFVTVINPPSYSYKSIEKETRQATQAINEDQLFKKARGKKLLEANVLKPLDFLDTNPDKLLIDVNPQNFKNPRARSRGLSLHTEINLGGSEEEPSKLEIPLYFDQTKTFEDIRRETEAWSNLYTASGMLADELGLDYDSDDSAIERFGKGLVKGAIGFFTFPVDLVMIASQWDKIQRWADAQNKSVWGFLADNLKESAKDPGFWGEITGSILASMGTSAIYKAMQPVVYEQPGGLSGYRQIVQEIKIDGDDIARAIRTEAFDFDELTRITVSKKYGLFGPKEIKVEKIPLKFSARSYESITAGDNVMATTRILDVPLSDKAVNVGTVKISQMASLGDDMARFVETTTKTLVNTDDIMNFLKSVKKGEAPNEIVKIISYNTDDLTKTIVTREIYDDVTKTSIDIKKFLNDDFLRVSKTSTKPSSSGTSLSTLNLDEAVKPPKTSAPASSGSLRTIMRDIAKELEDVKFMIKEWKGPVKVSTGPDIVIPGVKTPTLSRTSTSTSAPRMDIEDSTRIDTGTGSGTDDTTKIINDTRQDLADILDTGQDTRIDLDFDLDVNQLLGQVQDIDIDFRTSERQKTIIRDIEDIDIDFNVRDIMKDLTRLDIDTRAILAEVLDLSYDIPPEEPRNPKYRKDRPKKTPKPKKKKTAPKKKAPKKRKSDDWKEWVGYEPLFRI
ncbi:hypothetical protein ORF898 [Pyrococcus abyssi virus 1]|uniref:hypothetical protein n=1 Tax=Pyrococcus abyssi virus 1 TaxID=425386 RepID=UPI00015529C7|nr:hypothetical protein PAV1_ORF898 [Pyrococcus abyssi virus 1]ABN58506.1 hypothetical protein ORF898 [Pyrococcus abyssi virus 1]